MTRLSYKVLFTILTILSVLIVFFLKIRGNPLPARAAWYSNSWNYRQPVTVTYSGTTLTNYDILITLDTASLISAGKMQSDCDDLRITDSDEITLVTHWIEAGCNTATTQIWARIPSIPNGGKTIYAYYGNSGATNAEASWAGNFILIGSTDCPSGWSRYSALDSRFPYGAASVGTTGGINSHSHTQINVTLNPSLDVVSAKDYTGNMHSQPGHYHSGAVVDVGSTAILPPYLNVLFCSKSKLDIGTSQISLFTSTTPSGWTRFSALDSKFPRGATTYGSSGGSTTHTHAFTGGYATSDVISGSGWPWYQESGAGGYNLAAQHHTHITQGGTTASGDNTPPYLAFIFASKNSAGVGLSGMVVLTSSLPPLGWTRYTSLDSKFLYGAASYGSTGGNATHNHSVTITTGYPDYSSEGSANGSPASTIHTHSAATTSDSVSNLPPYYTVIYAQRNSPSPTTSAGSETHLNLVPNTPILTLPNDGALSQSRTPTFKTVATDTDNDYLQYELKICTNTGMTTGCTTFDQTTSNVGWSGQNVGTSAFASGTTATYILGAGNSLSFNTTYYWKTRATDPGGYPFRDINSPLWSNAQASPFSFATNYSPTLPTLISPSNLATTQPLTSSTFRLVTTDVDNDAIQYKIQLCQNSTMTLQCLTFDQTTSSVGWSGINVGTSAFSTGTTAAYIYTGSLLPNTTYYWQGYAIDPAGTNLWSATQATPFSFTTVDLPAPQNCLIEESSTETWLKIKWLDLSPIETAYAVDRKVDGGAYSNLTSALSAGTTGYTDATVSSGHTYQYRIAPIYTGPIYGQWCETSVLNLQTNSFKFDGLKLDGLKLN